jgi:hypothetical protein
MEEVCNYIIIITIVWVKINVNSTVDLQSVLESYGAEILNNLNSVKNALKWSLPLHIIPMKFKELLAVKLWGDLYLIKLKLHIYLIFLVSLFTNISSLLWSLSEKFNLFLW